MFNSLINSVIYNATIYDIKSVLKFFKYQTYNKYYFHAIVVVLFDHLPYFYLTYYFHH